jgi:hypothetical protein
MLKTVQGIVDEDCKILLLEKMQLKQGQRVLVVVLVESDEWLMQSLVASLDPEAREERIAQWIKLREKISASDVKPPSEAEIVAEVHAYRKEKRARKKAKSRH